MTWNMAHFNLWCCIDHKSNRVTGRRFRLFLSHRKSVLMRGEARCVNIHNLRKLYIKILSIKYDIITKSIFSICTFAGIGPLFDTFLYIKIFSYQYIMHVVLFAWMLYLYGDYAYHVTLYNVWRPNISIKSEW